MWYIWIQQRIKWEEVRLKSVSVLSIFVRNQYTNLKGPFWIKNSLWGREYPIHLALAFSSTFATNAKTSELQLAVYCSLAFICPEEELFPNSAWGSVLTAAEDGAQTPLHLSGNTAVWVSAATWLTSSIFGVPCSDWHWCPGAMRLKRRCLKVAMVTIAQNKSWLLLL